MVLTVADNSTDEDMNQCINITITDDNILEAAETFSIVLSTSEAHVMLGNSVTFITITDDDGKYGFHKTNITHSFIVSCDSVLTVHPTSSK